VRDLGRLDPVALPADRREVEVVGRVDGNLVTPDRPAVDHPERVKDVVDRRGGEALLAEVVDEVLYVAAMQGGQLCASEYRHDVRLEDLLVAASSRRLVGLAAAVEDGPVMGAGDQHL